MEGRFDKRGRLARAKGGGFYLVSEAGKELSVDQEAVSVWSMFSGKTVDQVAEIIAGGRSAAESRKYIAAVAGELEKAGFIVRV